jgi:nitrate/TMAO reductase-like tetraheme cytochrome c subunit
MELSISKILVILALGCAAASAAILVWYLVRRPPLSWSTKMLLLLGLGVFPIGAAATGNVVGFQHTMSRGFCGGCHVMEPFTNDVGDPKSLTLAARHSRNPMFGEESCYRCHEDYGMFGAVTTKMNGMRHVYEYWTRFHSMSIEEALPQIEMFKPYPNSNCMQCHSTQVPTWYGVPEHAALDRETRSGEVSCASAGCHGPIHPTTEGVPL